MTRVVDRDLHEESGSFWLVLEDDGTTVTYGHQLGSRVILRISGVNNPTECTMIVPDAFIMSDDDSISPSYRLVAFDNRPNFFEGKNENSN